MTRAREDMLAIQHKARQRLSAFLLRHERVYPRPCRWTKVHFRWLEEQRFEQPVQQVVFQEYVDTVIQAQARVQGLEEQMRQALASWSLRATVEALISLRGVNLITAMTVLAELGDLSRFDSPRQLMSFLGLVPSERSSGPRRRRRRCRHWPGRRKYVCVPATGICITPARTSARSPPRWRVSWWASSGPSPERSTAYRTRPGRWPEPMRAQRLQPRSAN